MQNYIAILRGINVGGNRIIKMEALRLLFTELGFVQNQTYIQSGNVIFKTTIKETKQLAHKIAEAITTKFGFDVPIIVISQNDLKEILNKNPFINAPDKDLAHLHVTFLSEKCDLKKYSKIREINFEPDEHALINNNIYLYCPNGYSNSKLTNGFFESKLKVTATTRNWKTCNELNNLAINLN
jgi:uncharacterized protein (DUF1697 family)